MSVHCITHIHNVDILVIESSYNAELRETISFLLLPNSAFLWDNCAGRSYAKKRKVICFSWSPTCSQDSRKPECLVTIFISAYLLNLVIQFGEGLLAPRLTPKLEDHPSSAVRGSLFNLFTATLHIGGRSWGRAMPWWHGPTCMLRVTHKLRCFLWRQNNPEVNYSPNRISGGKCF